MNGVGVVERSVTRAQAWRGADGLQNVAARAVHGGLERQALGDAGGDGRGQRAAGAVRGAGLDPRVLELTGLVTDDSAWGQWYVGNIANALSPSESTVYVDDITIGTTR